MIHGDEFQKLYFGRASAEKDYAADPEKFFRTYFDRYDIPARVANHERFLLLGPKGSGKSAAARYVDLSWRRAAGIDLVYSDYIDFDQVNQTQNPLSTITGQLVSHDVTTATDAAWRLFIAIKFLSSLSRDNGSSIARDTKAAALMQKLEDVGLADRDYPNVLRKVRERKISAGFSALFSGLGMNAGREDRAWESDQWSPAQIANALLALVLRDETVSRHLLSIDGLDKSIGDNRAYWDTVASLIRVGNELNTRFTGSNLYLLIMCRSDVFRRVRFSDSAEILADSSIRIEWGSEAADVKDVALWDYLAKKAEISKQDLIGTVPRSVPVGSGGHVPGLRFLVESTRYTPRDFSMLFQSIQSQTLKGQLPTASSVRKARDEFARNHFLNELESEAHGLLKDEVITAIPRFFSALKKRRVNRNQFADAFKAASMPEALPLAELGEYLYIQGALGNYDPNSGYTQFYHRRDANQFNPHGPWELHTSLVYAFNLKW
ncbi:hypothetical protein DEJ13_14640 [Curtobacterium sp. MCLR17_007]|uniref:P-loop ATPase, Sll1717 family n=1 Tax=Curtobacterium sp. MCLR17_007 TaxID=2175648 RepID=UPI0011B679BE|nr:hypothetical protein [Curtobacterium sp. MCLR17_007]WIB59666.1 hypothetical protein DEJ13_14640 [Curtobacterium sp. MCLR17_007]